ncbi:hypothetical protein Tco_1312818 [Tanacetum coccineum]
MGYGSLGSLDYRMADHNLWRIGSAKGTAQKRFGKDAKEIQLFILLMMQGISVASQARFGGNEESKKMKKTMLKQQFAEFFVTEEEGLHKGYDRFQKILSQLNQVQARPDNDDISTEVSKSPSSLCYGVKVTAAPTHSASWNCLFCSKPTYSDSAGIVFHQVSQTPGRSDNVMACVCIFCCLRMNKIKDMIYETLTRLISWTMEEMDLKVANGYALFLRINRLRRSRSK